jgi:asparagine synthase (glutamine-hydrolysing)
VIEPFVLSVRRQSSADGPVLALSTASGIAVGHASSGRLMAVLLGSVDTPAAAAFAQACEQGAKPESVAFRHAGAVVVLDAGRGQVSVVAPRIGLRQVYWACVGDELSLAHDPRALPCLAGATPSLRLQALYDYVYFHMVPGPGTIYEGVHKLQSGHLLEWTGGSPRSRRYWQPRFDETTRRDEPEAAEELRDVLQEAVRASLPDGVPAGAFLSGGLDSSTVAGMASQVRPGIPTVSMGFDAQGYDEMQYARIAAKRFGTTPLEYYVTPDDVLATLPSIAAAFPEPFGNSSAAAAYHCARIAREQGLTLLLAGDGGDELFGGNERYAKQLVFERYAAVPGVLRRALLEPAVSTAARFTRRFPVGKAQSYIEQARVPLPDRLQSYNFLHRHDPAEIFSAELLQQIDPQQPLRDLREEYAAPHASHPVNRMLFMDWRYTLHDNDLVKVNTMCALAGVDVAYPMLEDAAVDVGLRMPPDWKVRDGELRWFYKRAMRGFLPDEILTKTKHGFGLPFGVWTRTHQGLADLSSDALQGLRKRGYFRGGFVEEAERLHREGHASYYGELVWILTTLELWLRNRAV